jgi:hypothetical protein
VPTTARSSLEKIGIFDSLIYGEGKKILKSFDEIGNHDKEVFNDYNNQYYYFGDLDDEGLNIFRNLKDKAADKGIDISLWRDAYKLMFTLAEREQRWRIYKKQRSLDEDTLKVLLNFFDNNSMNRVLEQFQLNNYVPQEITNYRVLKKLLEEVG